MKPAAWKAALRFVERSDVDGDLEGVGAAAEEGAFDGSNVGVVAAPGDGDVVGRADDGVGGIDVEPEAFAAVDGDPGVRLVGANQPRFAGRRDRAEVADEGAKGRLYAGDG
jgi:hypothetical protein